jgi:phosphoserine aminotransferase
MLNYQTHIEHQSSYNTPPVFPIFVCLLTLRWIEKQGGLNAIEKNNKIKADLFYNTLDANPLFIGTAHKEDRSLMNATFLLKDVALEKEFLTLCKSAGIEGLKGHRSVGGFRASIYNAMPLESVEVLTQIMNDFAVQKG